MLLGILVLVVVHISVVTCAMLADVQRLLDDLFAPNVYNKEIRGTLDQSQPTLVSVDLGPKNIKSLREVEETLEMVSVIFLTWTDQRLAWEPDHYNDTRDLIATNCPLVMTSYPWDEHWCAVTLIVMGYTADHVKLVSVQKGEMAILPGYEPSSSWGLIRMRTLDKSYGTKSLISFELRLRRQPAFVTITIVLPVVALTCMNIFVFYIPVESGERISYSLTILLSVTLFISMVGEKLPSNGDGIASLCYFLVFAMFISGVTCLCNLVTLKLSSNATSGKPVPSLLQALVNCRKKCKQTLFCTSKNSTVNNIDKESNIPETNDVVKIGEKQSGVKEDSQVESRPPVTWMDASRWFDGVCVITTATFLILGGSMFTYNVINGQIP
ncbi:ACHD-like protein [Mya arenaria]|uniref:ACHD-like protein n=1 Tax=Mya arenaria TaxID=6604 RepID=A0ABY7DRJ4_MYAAR|nr:ACHD-like protein [Mya arenaria]